VFFACPPLFKASLNRAKKLIWVNDGHVLTSAIDPNKGVIQSMRMSDATALLNHFCVPASGSSHQRSSSSSSSSSSSPASGSFRQDPAFSAPDYAPPSLSSLRGGSGGSTAFGVAPSGFASIGVGPPEGAPAPRVWYAQRPPLSKSTSASAAAAAAAKTSDKDNDSHEDSDSEEDEGNNDRNAHASASSSEEDSGSQRSPARRKLTPPSEQAMAQVYARPRHAGRFQDRPTAELVSALFVLDSSG